MKLKYITFNIPVTLEAIKAQYKAFQTDEEFINTIEKSFNAKVNKEGYFNIHGIINLETGKVLDWIETLYPIEIFAKVCDEGIYAIFDEKFNKFGDYEGYVPMIFEVNERGYGDYFNMTIDAKGAIINWDIAMNIKIKNFLRHLKE